MGATTGGRCAVPRAFRAPNRRPALKSRAFRAQVWIQRGGSKDAWLKKMYDEASEGILAKLLKTSRAGHVYVAESRGGSSLTHKMDHLACFVGGMCGPKP